MRIAPFLLTLALAASPAWGQGRQVAIRTLCLAHSGTITEVSLPAARPGESAVTVPLLTASVSDVVEATFPGNEAVFYAPGSTPDKPVIAARGPLGTGKRQLLLFLPGPGGEGKPAYQVRSFDDDLAAFKMGSVRAINLAPVAVRFVVSGTNTPQIGPGKHAIFPHSSKVDDYSMYPVQVEFLSGNGGWHKSYSASWKASDRRREIVVTLVDGKFKQPMVKIFTDTPPWTEDSAGVAP